MGLFRRGDDGPRVVGVPMPPPGGWAQPATPPAAEPAWAAPAPAEPAAAPVPVAAAAAPAPVPSWLRDDPPAPAPAATAPVPSWLREDPIPPPPPGTAPWATPPGAYPGAFDAPSWETPKQRSRALVPLVTLGTMAVLGIGGVAGYRVVQGQRPLHTPASFAGEPQVASPRITSSFENAFEGYGHPTVIATYGGGVLPHYLLVAGRDHVDPVKGYAAFTSGMAAANRDGVTVRTDPPQPRTVGGTTMSCGSFTISAGRAAVGGGLCTWSKHGVVGFLLSFGDTDLDQLAGLADQARHAIS